MGREQTKIEIRISLRGCDNSYHLYLPLYSVDPCLVFSQTFRVLPSNFPFYSVPRMSAVQRFRLPIADAISYYNVIIACITSNALRKISSAAARFRFSNVFFFGSSSTLVRTTHRNSGTVFRIQSKMQLQTFVVFGASDALKCHPVGNTCVFLSIFRFEESIFFF